jgi:hypothetical protein
MILLNNIDRIKQKLINKFEKGDNKQLIFKSFSNYIIKEVKKESIAISYAEKIIKYSFDYLMYCNNFQHKQPTQTSLEGFLWIYYPQKYYLKRLADYITNYFKIKLDIVKVKRPIFKRPQKSHQILKQRVIYILNNPDDKHLTQKYIMDAFIGYFHWIYVPSNVFLSIKNIKVNKKNCFLKISTHVFFLPEDILKVKSNFESEYY